jgi:uncharacterized protein
VPDATGACAPRPRCNIDRPGSNLPEFAQSGPDALAPQHHEAFRRGIEDFNAGRFFEAHEVWEEIWLRSPEPEKTFMQGIIQVAAAFHHHSRGNARGTRNLLQAALERLEPFPDGHCGIDLATIRTEVKKWVAELGAGRVPGVETPFPQIKLTARA